MSPEHLRPELNPNSEASAPEANELTGLVTARAQGAINRDPRLPNLRAGQLLARAPANAQEIK